MIDGKLEYGERSLGIYNGYFVISYGESNVPVPQTLKDKINELVGKLESGELVLPKTKNEIDSWIKDNSEYVYSE